MKKQHLSLMGIIDKLLLLPTSLEAFGTGNYGGGGGDDGRCNYSKDQIGSAIYLEQQISEIKTDELKRLRLIGAICSSDILACGNLKEEEAGRPIVYKLDKRTSRWDS